MKRSTRRAATPGGLHAQRHDGHALVTVRRAEGPLPPTLASGALRLRLRRHRAAPLGPDPIPDDRKRVHGWRYVLRGQKIWTSRALPSALLIVSAHPRRSSRRDRAPAGLSVVLSPCRPQEPTPTRHPADHGAAAPAPRPRGVLGGGSFSSWGGGGGGGGGGGWCLSTDVEADGGLRCRRRGQRLRLYSTGCNAERNPDRVGVRRGRVAGSSRRTPPLSTVAWCSGRTSGGENQGVQFPIARAHAARGAAACVSKDAWLSTKGQKCAGEATMAKSLHPRPHGRPRTHASDAHGGVRVSREYGRREEFRETRLLLRSSRSRNNLVLATLGQHVLEKPRSY